MTKLTVSSRISQAASGITIFVGCVVLISWAFHIAFLKNLFTEFATMKANTALGLTLAGVSLLLSVGEKGRQIGQSCAIAVFLIGLLNLSQYLFGWNLGIDQLLFLDSVDAVAIVYPGRMGVNTALNFLFIGGALWLLGMGKRGVEEVYRYFYFLVQGLSLVAALICFQALLGYIYGVKVFYQLSASSSSMGIFTAIAFGLLSLGVLLCHIDRGFMLAITSDLNGGLVARRSLFHAITMPLILGWIILQGERANAYDSAFALSLLVVSLNVVFVALIWAHARFLNKVDTKRKGVEGTLWENQARLKQQADLLNLAYEANFVRDIHSNITYWNQGAEEMYGWTQAEALGNVSHSLLQSQFPEDCKDIDAILKQYGRWEGELIHTCKNGTKRIIESRQILIRDEEGEQIGFLEVNRDITARKQAEAALQDSEALLRLALDFSSAGVYDWKPLQNQVEWSPEYYKIFGLEASVVANYENWMERVHPDDRQRVSAEIAEMLQKRTELNVEYRILHPQAERWINARGKASYNETGEAVRVVGICLDVSDRKRAEVERDRLFTLLLDMLCIAGLDGYFRRINPAFERILGYTTQELLTQPFIDLIHPEDRENTDKEVKKMAEGVISIKFENRYRCKDGSYKWLVWNTVPDLDSGLLYACAHDITERKQMEQRLQQQANALQISQERLEFIIQGTSVGLWFWDLQLNKLHWNNNCKVHFGLPVDAEIDIHRFYQLLHPDDREFTQQAIENAIANAASYNVDYRTVAADGQVRWIQAIGKTYRDSTNTPTRFDGITIDITERKQAEAEIRLLNGTLEQRVKHRTAQLEAANKELESFSYSVSHDLRAPLRHIIGFVDLLRKRLDANALDETSSRYLNTITESTKVAGKLIDDLLEFSRMGRTEMRLTSVDMNFLFADVQRDLALEIKNREIYWQIEFLPTVYADLSMLKLVVRNLLENALKYSKTRSITEITIGSTSSQEEFIFFVKDNGIGFNMRYVHKLFGVFQRLHSDPLFEGTGVGLANVQRIVHRHGGRVWADSELERGATFYFSLPRETKVRSGE